MLSDLGKFLRKLRIDNDELLKDMAEKLSISTAMLSSVENEKRKAPLWFAQKIAEIYGLNEAERDELTYLVDTSNKRGGINIKTDFMSSGDKRLAFAFARKFPELDDGDKETLRRIFNTDGD